MNAVIKIEAHEDIKVLFILADGTQVTVHFRNGQLHACGTAPIVAGQRRPDVLAIAPAGARAGA